MNRVQAKLKSQKGETLVELVAAILVATLSVAMLMGGVAVSVRIDKKGKEMDAYFYQTLTEVESRKHQLSEAAISIKESGTEQARIPVNVYGPQKSYGEKHGSRDLYAYGIIKPPKEGATS